MFLLRHLLHDRVLSEVISADTFIVEESYISFLIGDDTSAIVRNWLIVQEIDEFEYDTFLENIESGRNEILVKKNINNILDR